MNPVEGPQVGPQGRAGRITGAALHLADPSAIIITRPLPGAVTYRRVGRMVAALTWPCVRVQDGAVHRDVLADQVVAGACSRVVTAPAAVLARVPRHHPDARRAIIGLVHYQDRSCVRNHLVAYSAV